jgi:hypothetical protein
MANGKQSGEMKSADELLDPAAVEREATITPGTQRVWRTENRYGFRDITIFVGDKPMIRRRDLRRWLQSRRGIRGRRPSPLLVA